MPFYQKPIILRNALMLELNLGLRHNGMLLSLISSNVTAWRYNWVLIVSHYISASLNIRKKFSAVIKENFEKISIQAKKIKIFLWVVSEFLTRPTYRPLTTMRRYQSMTWPSRDLPSLEYGLFRTSFFSIN